MLYQLLEISLWITIKSLGVVYNIGSLHCCYHRTRAPRTRRDQDTLGYAYPWLRLVVDGVVVLRPPLKPLKPRCTSPTGATHMIGLSPLGFSLGSHFPNRPVYA